MQKMRNGRIGDFGYTLWFYSPFRHQMQQKWDPMALIVLASIVTPRYLVCVFLVVCLFIAFLLFPLRPQDVHKKSLSVEVIIATRRSIQQPLVAISDLELDWGNPLWGSRTPLVDGFIKVDRLLLILFLFPPHSTIGAFMLIDFICYKIMQHGMSLHIDIEYLILKRKLSTGQSHMSYLKISN